MTDGTTAVALPQFGYTVTNFINEIWYGRHPLAVALAPLGSLYRLSGKVRRHAYQNGLLKSYRAPVPVIVVGNLTVGGTGKTPLVIWLAGYLKSMGYRPGVLARGYGGRARQWPQQVRADSDPFAVGDEAVVIARRAQCPVAAGPDRRASAKALIEHANCDVLISDDGLQHYALERDIEIAVIDGVRRFGNGRCLPAGPLREPIARLREVDMIVTYGVAGRGEFSMKYVTTHAVNLNRRDRSMTLESLASEPVHALAAIGHPERFFTSLRSRGLRPITHAFPDHHRFRASDLAFGDGLPILMTEKDAVKCEAFAPARAWFVPATAEMLEVFATRLETLLARGSHG
ncbi:MAG: tetraacyldisaccharide 4'-kinase [Gammaproteobacteria bacterium]|nr:tetraacyldisaccharide 4'-kinase [Gammaproteobacteria bacterium]